MKQWLKRTVCAREYKNKKKRTIQRLFLPSVLGIALCMAGLVGSTWAWFSASIQTKPQTIQAAEYQISVNVNGETVTGSKELMANTEYTVALTGAGTAKTVGGYCVVEGESKHFYTEQILPGETLTFTIIPKTTATYTFSAVWGEYAGKADISDDIIIGEKAASGTLEEKPPVQSEASGQTENDLNVSEPEGDQMPSDVPENPDGSESDGQNPEGSKQDEANPEGSKQEGSKPEANGAEPTEVQ